MTGPGLPAGPRAPGTPWWLKGTLGAVTAAALLSGIVWTAAAGAAALSRAPGMMPRWGQVIRALARSPQHSVTGLPDGIAVGPVWLFWTLTGALLAAALGAGYTLLAWRWRWQATHDPRRRAARYQRVERESSTAWADHTETRELVDDRDPMRLPLGVATTGETLAAPPRQSQAILAPTDAGKTSRYVVPAALRLCQARVPKVIASIKADVLALTWQAATETGPVWLFAPGTQGERPRCRWNPLHAAVSFGGASDVAGWLARSERSEHRPDMDMQFWHTLGRSLLTPMLFAAANTGHTLADIYRWVQYKNEDTVQQLLDQLHQRAVADVQPVTGHTEQIGVDGAAGTAVDLATGEVLGHGPCDVAGEVAGDADSDEMASHTASARARLTDVEDALAMWAATRGRDHRQKQSVFSTAETIFDGFNHPDVRALTTGTPAEADVFTPAKLLDTGGTLYLVATKTKVDQFGAVFEALMAQIVHEVEIRSAARNGRPIPTGLALILEEAANIARLPNLPYMASALRGLGVLLMTVWQDQAQIEELYGTAKARTILANHLWKIYLPGTTDDATLKSLSEQIGTYQRTETTVSTGHDGRISTTHRVTDTPAAPITDLQTMPADTAIAISGRRRPLRLRTRGWYQDPNQRRLIAPDVAAQFDTDFAAGSRAANRGTKHATTSPSVSKRAGRAIRS